MVRHLTKCPPEKAKENQERNGLGNDRVLRLRVSDVPSRLLPYYALGRQHDTKTARGLQRRVLDLLGGRTYYPASQRRDLYDAKHFYAASRVLNNFRPGANATPCV